MTKSLRLVVISGLLLVITLAGTSKRMSSGAPIGSTGAPGENTCAKSGCHDDNGNLNSGDGELRLTIQDAPQHYTPGQTYTMEVQLEEADILRFGFSLSSLDEQDAQAGTLLATDELRTQVLNGAGPFTGREYMTYKFAGTSAYSKGTGKWIFQWKAPEKDVGPVHFYFAAVSANNDGTDAGDKVYTASQVLPASPAGLAPLKEKRLSVFPNPVSDHLVVSYVTASAGNTRISLRDLNGRKLFTFWEGFQPVGEQQLRFQRPPLSPGIYLLEVRTGKGTYSEKISLR